MSTNIKTVGVIGTGVIGASWTALFLAKGLKVIVSDPAPGAEEKLAAYLEKQWPVLERIGVSSSASLSNYKFVSDIDSHLKSVDFVQEVIEQQTAAGATLILTSSFHRTHLSEWTSNANSLQISMQRHVAMSLSRPHPREYRRLNSSVIANRTRAEFSLAIRSIRLI